MAIEKIIKITLIIFEKGVAFSLDLCYNKTMKKEQTKHQSAGRWGTCPWGPEKVPWKLHNTGPQMADKSLFSFKRRRPRKRDRSSDHKRRGHWVNLAVDSIERLKCQTFVESTTIWKGPSSMKKANVWEIVNKEVESIIKGIEKGEIKTRKEYNEYINS